MFSSILKNKNMTLNRISRLKKLSSGVYISAAFFTGMLLSFYVSTVFIKVNPLISKKESPKKINKQYAKKNIASFINEKKSYKLTDTLKKDQQTYGKIHNIEKGSCIDSLKLTGTVVTDNKRIAVFEDLRTRKQHILKEREILGSFKIVQINRKSVTLRTDSYRSKKAIGAFNKRSSSFKETTTVIKKIGPHHYEIAKRIMMDNFADPAKLLAQVRFIPSIKDGISNGFMLKNIKKESFLNHIGFEEGDIITKINGHMLNNTFTAIKQFSSLGDHESVFIELSRQNKNIIIKYSMK